MPRCKDTTGDVVYIPLTQGMFAVIDRADAPLVCSHKWHAKRCKHTFYAMRTVKQNGRKWNIRMHRVILNAAPTEYVDHWDGDGLNNCRRNLRRCTIAQNNMNSRLRTNNRSGYRGVSRHSQNPRWVAHIRNRYIGTFDCAEEAAKAYDEMARIEFGEFARLNFPEE